MKVETPSGYVVKEGRGGKACLDVYEGYGLVCTLYGRTLSSYEDEDGKIDMDMLEDDIIEELD
jgi:hypothetical protein